MMTLIAMKLDWLPKDTQKSMINLILILSLPLLE